MANIQLSNITKIYPGGVKVIENLNLEIHDKEFMILVGPSGCGKSTTLRMIAGLEDITGGDLFIGENRVNDTPPKDRDIAMVFQNYALYPHMTVYKNMAFGLTLRKLAKAEIDKKVQEAAKVLDIAHLLGRKPKALSGGQRQRVALGRALVRDPSVFLLDEPLSNLDAKLRTQMRAEITRLHQRLGTTFVYVTHDQTEAMTMADRICVMKDGVIQQVDTPQNLYDMPCNLFVAGFIGSPQMNFIDAALCDAGGRLTLEFAGCRIPVPAEKEKLARAFIGKKVVLGLRPEAFDTDRTSPDACVEATLCLAERMGAEAYLHLTCAGSKIIVKAPAHIEAAVGSKMRLAIDPTLLHLFDRDTEQAIFH